MDSIIGRPILFTERTALTFIILTFIILSLCSFILIPYVDSYYYWNWGRHLALSYYDGPPIIAYLMRIFSILLGNSIYAINFLGVLSIFVTLFFIYKITLLIGNKQIALNACLLWLFSTPVFHYLFLWVTYDNPLNIFWAATIYFSIRYIHYQRIRDIYFIGVFAGLLLLSKYSGIVLLLSLFTFILINPRYKHLFTNKHFYAALIITFIISSPILIWNFQHDWKSISYQLNYHFNLHKYETTIWQALFNYTFKIMKTFDILLILPIYFALKSFKRIKNNDTILLLNWISLFFILFYLVISLQNSISKHWLTPYVIASSILCAYYFVTYHVRTLFIGVLSFYFLLGIYYLIVNCFFQQYFDKDWHSYGLIKKAGQVYLEPEIPVVTTNWQNASRLSFWLPGQPEVQTVACGMENQYSIWKKNKKRYKHVLYLDFDDHSRCVTQYFIRCQRLKPLISKSHYVGFNFIPGPRLFAYHCYS